MGKNNDTYNKLADLKESIKKSQLIFPQKLETQIKNQGNSNTRDITKGNIAFIRFKLRDKNFNVDTAIFKKYIETLESLVDYKTTLTGNIQVKEIKLPIDEIILPIIPVSDTLSSNWQGVNDLGLVDLNAINVGSNPLENPGDLFTKENMFGVAKLALKKSKKWIYDKLSNFSVETIAFKQKFLGGGIDNPHEKLLYSGHNRRSFTLTYNFLKPESKAEEEILLAILEVFRLTSIGNYGLLTISPPPTFDIEFISLPEYSNFLTYTDCGLNSCTVSFGGQGDQFHAMTSGFPFATLSLEFNELDFVKHEQVLISKTKGITFTE